MLFPAAGSDRSESLDAAWLSPGDESTLQPHYLAKICHRLRSDELLVNSIDNQGNGINSQKHWVAFSSTADFP
jgi:hypothetical protein